MANKSVPAHRAATWAIVFSGLMIAAGMLAIGLPLLAGVAITTVVAWLLTLSGALHIAFAWRGHGPAGVLWELLVGFVYAFIGVYLMTHPVAGLESLTLALAIYLSAEAVLEFVLWFRLRGMPRSAWLFVDGIITVVLAVLIWRTWPSSSTWVVGTLVGISMLFSGGTRLALSLAARRLGA